ncbi:MAG: abortive infection system antitoxin AbiGi family protein [Flavobacterium sp.]
MNLSSNTLFHYTKSLSNLKSILQHRFKLAYCKEEITIGNEKHVGYYPMVTFCDIPLSLANKHIKKYGNYAIGLKKEWGVTHRLNPVIYLDSNSLISEDIISSRKNIDNFFEIQKSYLTERGDKLDDTIQVLTDMANTKNFDLEYINNLFNFKMNLDKELDKVEAHTLEIKNLSQKNFNIFRYAKNYEGNLERNGIPHSSYRFYDEREWRFVPSISSGIPNLDEDGYRKYRGSKNTVKPLLDSPILNFSASDIKYIIVEKASEISDIIAFMRRIDNFVNSNEVDVLSTKIITLEQLNEDF